MRRPQHLAASGVGRSIAVAAAALVLAALLNAEALHHTATSQPFGWRHDVATAVADPLLDVSRALRLTEPRHWLEDLFDRPSTRPEAAPEPSPTTTTPPTSTSTSVPGSSTSVPSTTVTTAPAAAHRAPTAADPLRLVVAGDSMTESAGPALVGALESTGVVDAVHDLRYSSGLTRPDFFDWPANLARLVDEHDAEAVVFWVGANDAQGIQTPTGPAAFGTDAWVAEYRGRVAALMCALSDRGLTVYWIGEPIMRDSGYDGRMSLITGIYRDEATRHDGVRFVDTRALFSDESGGYSAYLPGADGRPVLVRRDDGIHLTPAGADRLAPTVLAAVEHDWDLGR